RSSSSARAHVAMCELECVSPGSTRVYRTTVFLPRAWRAAACTICTATATCGACEAATCAAGSGSGEHATVLQLRLEVVAVHQRDVVDRDRLRARGFALGVVRARAEVLLHRVDHRFDSSEPFRLALREEVEVRHLR